MKKLKEDFNNLMNCNDEHEEVIDFLDWRQENCCDEAIFSIHQLIKSYYPKHQICLERMRIESDYLKYDIALNSTNSDIEENCRHLKHLVRMNNRIIDNHRAIGRE